MIHFDCRLCTEAIFQEHDCIYGIRANFKLHEAINDGHFALDYKFLIGMFQKNARALPKTLAG